MIARISDRSLIRTLVALSGLMLAEILAMKIAFPKGSQSVTRWQFGALLVVPFALSAASLEFLRRKGFDSRRGGTLITVQKGFYWLFFVAMIVIWLGIGRMLLK
jgi:hypothetical protein